MIKIFVVTLVVLGSLFLIIDKTQSDDVLTIEVAKGNQSGITYEIPIEILIHSDIQSDRFELNIEIPDGLSSTGETNFFGTLLANQDYHYAYNLTPEEPGHYKVVINGQLWQAATNYKTVASVEFNINENLELEPVSTEFQNERRNYKIIRTVITFLILVFIALIIWKLYEVFKRWLNADDNVEKKGSI